MKHAGDVAREVINSRPLKDRVKLIRAKKEAEKTSLNTIQRRMHEAGFQSVFAHTQGDGNVFILWINLQTGVEAITVSGKGPRFGGEDVKQTGIYKLYPVIDIDSFFEKGGRL